MATATFDFGAHPDPTAINTLGLALVTLRGIRLWVIATVPVLWLVLSMLTFLVLDVTRAIPLFVVLGVGVLGLACKSASWTGRGS